MPREFGLAEAIAAALSGLTGGNFTNLLAAQSEEEKEREERAKYRAEETRRYEEEKQHRTEREKLEDILRASEFTSDLFAELPQNRAISEDIPLATAPDGSLTSAPDTNSRVMTGDPGIDQWLTTLAPGNEAAAGLMGQSMGRSIRARSDREREENRSDLLFQEGFTELRDFMEWEAKERKMTEDKFRADIAHTYASINNMNRQAAEDDTFARDMERGQAMAHDMLQTEFGLLVQALKEPPNTTEEYITVYRQAMANARANTNSPAAKVMIAQDGLRIINNIRRNRGE